MHRHRHLFERIAALENLIAAGKAALRGKRSRLPGAAFLADFEKEVFALHEELCAGTNAPVRRVACVAAIGTTIPTTCTPPIATTTTRRTRTTT